MEEARKIKMEKAKALQEERRRVEFERKAQEEAATQTAQGAQTKEKEIVDLTSTIEHMKRVEWEKYIEEQRAAQLAREKIKEALKRKAKESVLEPREGSPKRPRQENEEELENIQLDPTPPSPSTTTPPVLLASSPQPPSSPKSPSSPKPSPLQNSPKSTTSSPAPTSPQQQQDTAKIIVVPPPSHQTDKESVPGKDKEDQEMTQAGTTKPKPAKKELQIPLMQLAEPTQEEAYEEKVSMLEFAGFFAKVDPHGNVFPSHVLASHYLQTFEEAFVTGFFEISTQIFHPMVKDLKARLRLETEITGSRSVTGLDSGSGFVFCICCDWLVSGYWLVSGFLDYYWLVSGFLDCDCASSGFGLWCGQQFLVTGQQFQFLVWSAVFGSGLWLVSVSGYWFQPLASFRASG
ncbi:hypothetical protein L7F22_050108 [Adiantum nelumboides]|nr:hypothetical protein [Adiantum nelumboides]